MRKVFNEIWIVSPTVFLQPAWTQLHPEGIKVFNSEITPRVLTKIVSHRKNHPEISVLLILDDCGKVLPTRELAQLFYLSRHLKLACVFLCQKITSCPTEVRSQVDCFISFSNTALREKQALWKEVGKNDFNTFVKEFEEATSQPYGTFVCSMQGGRPFYFRNVI